MILPTDLKKFCYCADKLLIFWGFCFYLACYACQYAQGQNIPRSSIAVSQAVQDSDNKITIDECVAMAKMNYPQIRQFDLISEAEKYDLSNAGLNWVPHITISGKASYQSDVVEMPFEIPGYDFDLDLPHDQYSIVGEVSQTIWDGGTTSNLKSSIRAGAEVQRKQLEVTLYSIRERVENIYLGILLIDKQISQNKILEKSLLRNRNEVMAMLENGMAYKSDMNIVDVNILNCRQKLSQLLADRSSYIKILSKFTGSDMSGVSFIEPSDYINTDSLEINRPELSFYDAQVAQNQVKRNELQTRISPKFNFTFQGGAGQPGLNMLKEGFSPYYVAAIKMQWSLGDLYTRSNDIKKIESNEKSIESERETFLFNTSMDIINQVNAIEKARDVLEQDKEIVRLREEIRTSGEEQYAEGVITMIDLMDMIDNEHDARVAESIHQVQLLMEICKLKNTVGQ